MADVDTRPAAKKRSGTLLMPFRMLRAVAVVRMARGARSLLGLTIALKSAAKSRGDIEPATVEEWTQIVHFLNVASRPSQNAERKSCTGANRPRIDTGRVVAEEPTRDHGTAKRE